MSGIVDTNLGRNSGSIGAPASGKAVTESSSDPAIDTNPATGVGTFYLNTSSGFLFCCTDSTEDSNHWINVGTGEDNILPPIPFLGDRAVFAGGLNASTARDTVMDYFSISGLGTASDFGDLTGTRQGMGGCSNRTRGLFMGGYNTNIIDYITVGSTGNAVDFGDITATVDQSAALSNGTRACRTGGYTSSAVSNVIDYVTVGSTGNAIDFGDLTLARENPRACSNETRGLILGGYNTGASPANVIDYITVASTGNATDFGDLTGTLMAGGASCHRTRALYAEGTTSGYAQTVVDIQYVTIASTGNAIDFGDSPYRRYWTNSCSDGTKHVVGGGDTHSDARTNVCMYATIDTLGNGTAFGNLSVSRRALSALAGS